MKFSRRFWLGFWLPGVLVAGLFGGCAKFQPPHVRVEQFDGRQIRVACVGDSITYGAGIEDREKQSYPAQLAELLGPSFEVRNFGRNGATMSRTGDLPYWETEEFAAATEFVPDVVILKLGTNDTKPQNWKGAAAFEADFRALVNHFKGIKNRPRPKIWVCLPVPVYEDKWGINAATLNEGVLNALMRVSNRQKIPVIDLHDALDGHSAWFSDGVHPNEVGARQIARTIYDAIRP